MSDRGAYIRAIEAHFLKYRGSGFVLSPKDEAVVERWYDKQIPLQSILRQLDAAVNQVRERDSRSHSRPRSIAFFARQVETQTERIPTPSTPAYVKVEAHSKALQFRENCATELRRLRQCFAETGSAARTLDAIQEKLGRVPDEGLWEAIPELDAEIDRLLIASMSGQERVRYKVDAEARVRRECGPYLSPAAREEQEQEALAGLCRKHFEFKGLMSIAGDEL